ncbi:alpha/beta fold hydrolase [Marinobacterium arenosum]|uniref:alpha/beta fold hydrolase n=1 Tax=Marinobacterium arenosum TaxID=2862496 RepID=UPI001C9393A5|nr:alpha/beta hydrolase [Marinobacterium arenosum]MBY4675239.1 alpha/beta hydrolase [Marinobacterium arenosum]
MQHPCQIEQRQLELPDQHLHYRIYRNPNVAGSRRLVLLHGAGVAGEDTWGMITAFLSHWREILVPDQRGMGQTRSPDGQEHPYNAEQLMLDLSRLVDHLGWWRFDLGGYSMGGLISLLYKQAHPERVDKQYLLESAILDRPCWESTVILRQQYSGAAQLLRQGSAEQGVRNFLDTISPNRKVSTQAEQTTVSRLAGRPLGFANALDCVTSAINNIDREQLVAAQGDVTSFIGGLSVDLMHQYHEALAERMPNWHYFMVPGTDHSLPFQKPRQIARIMDAELDRYLAARDT